MKDLSELEAGLSTEGRAEAEVAQDEVILEMGLRQFRREISGLTQGSLAQRMSVSQPEVSKLESRRDMLISTLREYCSAVGAELHIVMDYGGVKVRLMLPEVSFHEEHAAGRSSGL
jgi:DNA-binding transcriptional regulator YiaG